MKRLLAPLFLCSLVPAQWNVLESPGRAPDPDPEGTRHVGSTSSFPSKRVGVAHDPITDRYLVAWSPGTEGPIDARLVGPRAGLLSFKFGVGDVQFLAEPQVVITGSAPNQQFAIVGIGGNSSGGDQAVHVSTWPAGNSSALTSLAASHRSPDIGGGLGRDDVVIVYQDADAEGVIRAAQFDTASMTTVKVVDLSDSLGSRPRISPHAGPNGEYLVVWGTGGGGQVLGRVIDRNLNLLTPTLQIANSPEYESPGDVDGDGRNWMVTYGVAEPGSSELFDVYGIKVAFDPITRQATRSAVRIPIATVRGQDEQPGGIAWVGESLLVMYHLEFVPDSGDYDVWVSSRDPFRCEVCEGDFKISTAVTPEAGATVASQRSSGGLGGDALMAYLSIENPAPVRVQAFRGRDGLVTDLGGSCSGGGRLDASCAIPGGRFALRLRDAARSAPAALILGTGVASSNCGPCTLMTSPILTVPMMTGGRGGGEFLFSNVDPSFVGASLVAQWVVAGNGGCGSILSLSNGIQVTIE